MQNDTIELTQSEPTLSSTSYFDGDTSDVPLYARIAKIKLQTDRYIDAETSHNGKKILTMLRDPDIESWVQKMLNTDFLYLRHNSDKTLYWAERVQEPTPPIAPFWKPQPNPFQPFDTATILACANIIIDVKQNTTSYFFYFDDIKERVFQILSPIEPKYVNDTNRFLRELTQSLRRLKDAYFIKPDRKDDTHYAITPYFKEKVLKDTMIISLEKQYQITMEEITEQNDEPELIYDDFTIDET